MRRNFELKDISWFLFTFDFLKGLHDFGSLPLMRVIIKSFIQIIHGSIGLQQVNTNFDLFRNPYIICISNCLTFNLTCVLWHIEFVKLDYISSIEFSICMSNDPHDIHSWEVCQSNFRSTRKFPDPVSDWDSRNSLYIS